MSREKDLIDLIKTANEIYLMNPTGNVRTAYILIDDLCELMMKSLLQTKDSSWSPDKANGSFKHFKDITKEVKDKFPGNGKVERLLDNINSRRTNRNHFFHDQRMTGLTVTDENCLEAFRDLFDLLNTLFPNAFKSYQTSLLNAQTATIRVLLTCAQSPEKKRKYNDIINKWKHGEGKRSLKAQGELILTFSNLAYDYCVIQHYPDQFHNAL